MLVATEIDIGGYVFADFHIHVHHSSFDPTHLGRYLSWSVTQMILVFAIDRDRWLVSVVSFKKAVTFVGFEPNK